MQHCTCAHMFNYAIKNSVGVALLQLQVFIIWLESYKALQAKRLPYPLLPVFKLLIVFTNVLINTF